MRKIVKIIIPTLLIAILANGCSDIGEASLVSLSIPEVENGKILFKGNELSKDVHINSNKDWKIEVEYLSDAKDWLTVRPSSGKGGESVHIEASDDYYKPDTVTRSATLTLTVGELQPRLIKVDQHATKMEIEVSKSKIELDKKGEKKELLKIDCNTMWTSTYEEFDSNFNPNWYQVNKTNGRAGSDSIQLSAQSNMSFSVNNSTLLIYPENLDLNDSIRYPHLFKKVIVWQPIKHFLEPEIQRGQSITQPLEFESSGGKRNIIVGSNVEWFCDNYPDWIKFEIIPTENPLKKRLEITALENSMQNGKNPGPKEGTFSIVGISDDLDPNTIEVKLSQKPPTVE